MRLGPSRVEGYSAGYSAQLEHDGVLHTTVYLWGVYLFGLFTAAHGSP